MSFNILTKASKITNYQSLLYSAVQNNDVEQVKYYLNNYINPNIEDKYNCLLQFP